MKSDAASRIALARALHHLDPERFAWVAAELANEAGPTLARELARALLKVKSPKYVDTLANLLRERSCRTDARRALVSIGEAALDRLTVLLNDPKTPPMTRRHLPRTIAQFGSDRAAHTLQTALLAETDQRVVFRMLRALGRMRAADPTLTIDRGLALDTAAKTVKRAITALHWRLAVGSVVAHQQQAMTPAAELLVAFLDEVREAEIQKTFRLLHILEPTQEFRIIYDGLRSQDDKAKASSRELLSHVVPEGVRDGILAMVDDTSLRTKLKKAESYFVPEGRPLFLNVLARLRAEGDTADNRRELGLVYADTLRAMLAVPGDALRSIVCHHVAELGLEPLLEEVARAADHSSDVLKEVADETLGLFSPSATV